MSVSEPTGRTSILDGLGYSISSPSATSKTVAVNPKENSRARVEQEVAQFLEKIRLNRNITALEFRGKKLRLGIDDIARILNSELEKVNSKKRTYFIKEPGFPVRIFFGDVSDHLISKNTDVLIFEENEKISTLDKSIYGRSNTLWKMTAVRKKGCNALWSEFERRAFDAKDPFVIEMLNLYGAQNANTLSSKRKQAIHDLAECIMHHELVHQDRKYFAAGYMSSINLAPSRNTLLDLLEMRAELGVLNHIIDIKDQSKATKLALLWSLYAYGSRMAHKAVLSLILLSSMTVDSQTGKIYFNFNRLSTIVKKFSKKLDEEIASIESGIKQKIKTSFTKSEIETEKRNIRSDLSSAKYPLAKKSWFIDNFIWGNLCKKLSNANPEVKDQVRIIIKEGVISTLQELLSYSEIADKTLPYGDLLYSVQILIDEQLVNLKLR